MECGANAAMTKIDPIVPSSSQRESGDCGISRDELVRGEDIFDCRLPIADFKSGSIQSLINRNLAIGNRKFVFIRGSY